MFLDTLERIRPKNAQSTSQDTTDEGEVARNSIRSSSSSSSPSSRSTKRYSNNLFGSGRLRDYTYLKTGRGSVSSSARTTSMTPTEATEKTFSLSSFRPVTPDGGSNSSSVQSSPNEKGPIRSTPSSPSSPIGEQQFQAITAAEYRLHKTLGPSVLKRASMALDEAIREIEDEVEDEILLPRSVPASRGSLDQPTAAELVRPYLCC
jgi:serine/arginine repetitive matrix protein 2